MPGPKNLGVASRLRPPPQTLDVKASDPLRSKVDRNQAACEQLHAARAVLWVVNTRAAADRLRDLGVDDPRRPSQILVPARDVGISGEDLGPVRRPWWVTRVPADGETLAS
jgi:hypothetical protein